MFACVPGLSTFSGSVQCSCSYLVACTTPGIQVLSPVCGRSVCGLAENVPTSHIQRDLTDHRTTRRQHTLPLHTAHRARYYVRSRHAALQPVAVHWRSTHEAQMCHRPRATGTARLADSRSTVGSASGYSTALAGTEAKGRERSRGAGGAMAETRPRARRRVTRVP